MAQKEAIRLSAHRSSVVFRPSSALSQHVQQPTRTGRAIRCTPDGKAALYISDSTSYSNMSLVEVGEFDKLPDLE